MAVTIDAYDQLVEIMSDGTMDMDTDTFKMILLNNSHTRTVTNTLLTQVNTNEIANANGYVTGGATLTSVTFAHTTGSVKWDSADVTWTATGGAITAYHAVIYDDTVTSPADALCVDINFDGVQTAGDTTNFVVAPNAANGWFTGSFTAG